MKRLLLILLVLTAINCREDSASNNQNTTNSSNATTADLTMVFASCNDQDREQPLWEPIVATEPDVFVWGGDNIYADTDDMEKMEADYNKVWANPLYTKLAKNTHITGAWDDHDYGLNDAGAEWIKKEEAQQLFLDFLKVPSDDPRRNQEGTYYSEIITTEKGTIKLIVLDTRYFRSPLKKSEIPNRQYDMWPEDHQGTILGADQWSWLASELEEDTADFTVIVSSIQYLSSAHGWERWQTFPSEAIRLRNLLKEAKAKRIMILSGDRHMAEISVDPGAGLDYPLIDFTSSGMTHTWPLSATEGNPFRVSNVIKRLNFGVLLFDFDENKVTFQIRGRDGFLFEEFTQQY